MSVYTPVSSIELEIFLLRYEIGALIHYAGIENGITNSNFWLQTEAGSYVLTLYEHHQPRALDYILALQHHLAEQGVACATPIIDRQQGYYSVLNNRPAAIANRIDGEVCQELTSIHCASIGGELAKFHLAGQNYGRKLANPCGRQWRLSMQQKLLAVMTRTDRLLLQEEIRAYQVLETISLPTGSTHSDLFHDNCLFSGKELAGIIDFDYACNESFLYDLAITINDCCLLDNNELNLDLLKALVDAYDGLRPLQPIEKAYLNLMLRVAATRFWLSRLHDLHFPLVGELTFKKDPDKFKRILLLRRELE